MTTITLSKDDWAVIEKRIVADYGLSTAIISWKLKATLGFTVRTHHWFAPVETTFLDLRTNKFESAGTTRYVEDIRLDFDDEAAATFFRMKYV